MSRLKRHTGEDIEMRDILVSLVLETNPKLTTHDVERLVTKYFDMVWERATEVCCGT